MKTSKMERKQEPVTTTSMLDDKGELKVGVRKVGSKSAAPVQIPGISQLLLCLSLD